MPIKTRQHITSILTTLALTPTDIRHQHRHQGGMSKKTPPPTELQIPVTVTTLNQSTDSNYRKSSTVLSFLHPSPEGRGFAPFMPAVQWQYTNIVPPRHHITSVLRRFFQDHPGEPVPEENFWTLWCKGRLTEADTPTIRQRATPSGPTSAHLHHPPFFTGRMPFLPPKQQCQSTEGKTLSH